jgi:hypothetical protein
MEPITYSPLAGYKTSTVVLGTILTMLGSLILCVSCLAPIAVLATLQPSNFNEPVILASTIGGALCGGLLGLLPLVFGVRGLFSAKPSGQVELTDEELIYKHGRKTTTLRLSELAKLTTRVEQTKRGGRYWVIRLHDKQGAFIDLEVSQDDYMGLFDTQAIVRDTLARLKSPAQMEMRIKKYLETGRLE